MYGEGYSCDVCKYGTADSSNYSRHLKSKRHLNTVNKPVNDDFKPVKTTENDYYDYGGQLQIINAKIKEAVSKPKPKPIKVSIQEDKDNKVNDAIAILGISLIFTVVIAWYFRKDLSIFLHKYVLKDYEDKPQIVESKPTEWYKDSTVN